MNIETKNNMKVITPDEGYVLTTWDGNDILEFSYYRKVYAPLTSTIEYREITEEEKNEYERQLEEKVKDMV